MPKNIATILMLVLAVASATAGIRHYCDFSTVCHNDADGNKLWVTYITETDTYNFYIKDYQGKYEISNVKLAIYL